MQPTELLAALDALGHPRALVVGDLILDRYTWGNAERISQEAPVLLLRADRRESRLGGAANVCQMLRGLEAEVTVAGVVGSDDSGRELREMLSQTGVRCDMALVDMSRPTTVKERFIGRAANKHPHQILRVDSEVREPLSSELEAEFVRRLLSEIDRYDVVVISDYAKGVCTPKLLRQVIDAARAAGLPVVVDPVRTDDYSRYRGATTMTPNRNEAECASGVKINRPEDAFEAFCPRLPWRWRHNWSRRWQSVWRTSPAGWKSSTSARCRSGVMTCGRICWPSANPRPPSACRPKLWCDMWRRAVPEGSGSCSPTAASTCCTSAT
ncbi:MAG: hypothetical protein K8T25_19060 [Planctomycetia bacterium]|nr:hypothetical protein [Planctomycetia bacterium]